MPHVLTSTAGWPPDVRRSVTSHLRVSPAGATICHHRGFLVFCGPGDQSLYISDVLSV